MVVDTNVLISALMGHGKPRRLVRKLLQKHDVVSSPQLLVELFDVLSRKQFDDLDVNSCMCDTLHHPKPLGI